MAENVTTAVLEEWVRKFATLVADNRDHLTELDAAIGDADHGSNMDRGMKAAVAALDETAPTDRRCAVHQGRDDAGLHRRWGQRPAVRHVLPPDGHVARRRRHDDAARLRGRAAGRAGRRRRARQGRARRQDDVRRAGARRRRPRRRPRRPAQPCRRRSRQPGDAAAAGRDATTPMLARKGRASYLGERSVGHQDPGATTVALLLEAATESPSEHIRRTRNERREQRGECSRHDSGHADSPTQADAASAWSSCPTAGRSLEPPSRWRRRCCTAARCGSRWPPASTSTTFGTDAVSIKEAIERADGPAGVVVLMDLGSAVLSAELASTCSPTRPSATA